MATYLMPSPWSETQFQSLKKLRLWLSVMLVPCAFVAIYFGIQSTGSSLLYGKIGIGSLLVLAYFWGPLGWRSTWDKIASASRVNSITLDGDGLSINYAAHSRLITRDEISQVEEPPKGRGLYVRTNRKALWFVIPRRIDRYEAIKEEMVAMMGAPIRQTTTVPWNWGILFVCLFCASLLCNLLTQDRRVITVNFVVAIILGCTGAIVTTAWTQDRRVRLQSLFGSFLPAAFSALYLFFPFGLR